MKLEESQILYDDLSRQIIRKQEARTALKRKLQDSNTTYQKEKKVTLLPWEFKNIQDEIDILNGEIETLVEKRNLVKSEISRIVPEHTNGKK